MSHISQRMALAQEMGWRHVSEGGTVFGFVKGPCGFSKGSTIIRTLPPLIQLQREQARRTNKKVLK